MKRILLCVFSSSGNTQFLTEGLQEGLSTLGYNVRVHTIENTERFPQPDEYDILGIATPVFAFREPIIVKQFLKRLPQPTIPTPAFLFISYGGIIGNMVPIFLTRLRKKNFLPVWKGGVRSEDNYPVMRRKWTMPFIHEGHPTEDDYQKVIHTIAKRIHSAIRESRSSHLIYNPLALLLDLGGAIYQKLTPYFIRHKINRDKCTQCAICVKYCPTHALTYDNKNYPQPIKGRCIGCYRCVNICPEKAFHTTLSKRGLVYNKRINKIMKNLPSEKSIFKRIGDKSAF